MKETTEKKFLDAALKIFAEKGYVGATTSIIAEEAGFSEKTLFRGFKTKKNLYDLVLIKNAEKFVKEFMELVDMEVKFDTPKDFFDDFIKNLDKVMFENFEFFKLSINEPNKILEPMMENAINFIVNYMKKNISHQDIDYKIFAFTIVSFIYTINLERYSGRTYIVDDDPVNKFIKNIVNCSKMEIKSWRLSK